SLSLESEKRILSRVIKNFLIMAGRPQGMRGRLQRQEAAPAAREEVCASTFEIITLSPVGFVLQKIDSPVGFVVQKNRLHLLALFCKKSSFLTAIVRPGQRDRTSGWQIGTAAAHIPVSWLLPSSASNAQRGLRTMEHALVCPFLVRTFAHQ